MAYSMNKCKHRIDYFCPEYFSGREETIEEFEEEEADGAANDKTAPSVGLLSASSDNEQTNDLDV